MRLPSRKKLNHSPKSSRQPRRLYKPEVGGVVCLRSGEARVLCILDYDQVIEEMKLNGMQPEEIRRFRGRVWHFLGDEKNYFECEVIFSNGEVERFDWSDLNAFVSPKRSS